MKEKKEKRCFVISYTCKDDKLKEKNKGTINVKLDKYPNRKKIVKFISDITEGIYPNIDVDNICELTEKDFTEYLSD